MIQFWEFLKNSLGIVKVLGVEPSSWINIHSCLPSATHERHWHLPYTFHTRCSHATQCHHTSTNISPDSLWASRIPFHQYVMILIGIYGQNPVQWTEDVQNQNLKGQQLLIAAHIFALLVLKIDMHSSRNFLSHFVIPLLICNPEEQFSLGTYFYFQCFLISQTIDFRKYLEWLFTRIH